MRCLTMWTGRQWAYGLAFALAALGAACEEDRGATPHKRGAGGSPENGGAPNIDFGVPAADAMVMLNPSCPVASVSARSPIAYGKGQLDAALAAANAMKSFC